MTTTPGSSHDPADPAWVWLSHYRQASRRRHRRNWHRHREGSFGSRRWRPPKRALRPLLAVTATLAFVVTAAIILLQ
jgi:hypothetical protein